MVYDLIIIGSGPAGLAAAIYAARARLSFLVLEKMPLSGGQILNTYEVENYPGIPTIGGFELGMKLREHAEHQGTEMIHIEVRHISLEEQGRIKVLYTDGKEYRARTVILAMGAKYRTLGIPGEKELTGMGVSYCATCDGAFFRGRKVAVVGGGDVAAEDALFLARGCEKVYSHSPARSASGSRGFYRKSCGGRKCRAGLEHRGDTGQWRGACREHLDAEKGRDRAAAGSRWTVYCSR